jgi:hypothetical protein
MNRTRFFVLTGMVLAAVLSKFLPHPVNFAPIGAIALFGGAHFQNRALGFVVPFAALLIGDLITGLHSLIPFVYGCFALNVCLGWWIRRQVTALRVLGVTLVGSTVFFLVTNFGVWLLLGTFEPTTAGLIQCYIVGLPLFLNTVLGDLFYAAVLFGGQAFLELRFPRVLRIEANAL